MVTPDDVLGSKAMWALITGDCVETMRTLPGASVDSVVTDPPYLLGFMDKEFDKQDGSHTDPSQMESWHLRWATEAFRVLKPGGHLLAFGGTRTHHRLVCAIEDAGFEIRDTIDWVYSTGFPKSHNVGKAIDKDAGAERRIVGQKGGRYDYGFTATSGAPLGTLAPRVNAPANMDRARNITQPATELATEWEGFGTALKPAHEPIVVARKPLVGTVVENVTKFGTGALNIDAVRVSGTAWNRSTETREDLRGGMYGSATKKRMTVPPQEMPLLGRWPPNLVLTHSPGCVRQGNRTIVPTSGWRPTYDWESEDGIREQAVYASGKGLRDGAEYQGGFRPATEEIESWRCVDGCPVAELDRQSGETTSGELLPGHGHGNNFGVGNSDDKNQRPILRPYGGDSGGASRFFPQFGWDDEERSFVYVPKAARSEREAGLDDLPQAKVATAVRADQPPQSETSADYRERFVKQAANLHPTVKPISLMRWLVRLVTPKDGLVLDPFVGSGTTGCVARLEGLRFIGIDKEPTYVQIAERRIRYWETQPAATAPIAPVQRTIEQVAQKGLVSLEERW